MSGYRQNTHIRAVWPPKAMVRMEEQIGRPVVEYLAELIAETGSVDRATEALASEATPPSPTWPTKPGTIREWWNIACRTDPDLRQLTWQAREDQRSMKRLVRDGERAERKGLLAEIAMVRDAMNGKSCPVDGAPIPQARTLTCSTRCAELWPETRYHLSDEHREKHRGHHVRWVLAHADQMPEPTVRYAKRLQAGEPTEDRGRWITSAYQRELLHEVMERRAQAKAKWGDLAADLPPIKALEKKSA